VHGKGAYVPPGKKIGSMTVGVGGEAQHLLTHAHNGAVLEPLRQGFSEEQKTSVISSWLRSLPAVFEKDSVVFHLLPFRLYPFSSVLVPRACSCAAAAMACPSAMQPSLAGRLRWV